MLGCESPPRLIYRGRYDVLHAFNEFLNMPHVITFVCGFGYPSFIEALDLQPTVKSATATAIREGDLPIGLSFMTKLANAKLRQFF
jgi:hypothetical protein